jgi:hypothetical protein
MKGARIKHWHSWRRFCTKRIPLDDLQRSSPEEGNRRREKFITRSIELQYSSVVYKENLLFNMHFSGNKSRHYLTLSISMQCNPTKSHNPISAHLSPPTHPTQQPLSKGDIPPYSLTNVRQQPTHLPSSPPPPSPPTPPSQPAPSSKSSPWHSSHQNTCPTSQTSSPPSLPTRPQHP